MNRFRAATLIVLCASLVMASEGKSQDPYMAADYGPTVTANRVGLCSG
jgi:hypothetical protein